MTYRISEEEMQAAQAEYKRKYEPFRPYRFTNADASAVAHGFYALVTTQNGQDTDDYCIEDNNKVERYLLEVPQGSSVLLLGVGAGREVLVARELGMNATGVTLGSRNTDYGTKYLRLPEDKLLECLNEALPFPKDTFDVVAGFQVFEHAIAPLLFLLEQYRVLKPKGKLLLEWPPADKFSMDDNPHHQVCFTPGQAHALFRKAGFENIKLYYDDFTPIPESDWWRADQDKMLVIEGIKGVPSKPYIRMINDR